MRDSQHLFSFYTEHSLSECSVNQFYTHTDQELSRRISVVLRLSTGDRIELFNGTTVISLELTEKPKKRQFTGKILTITPAPEYPQLTLCVGLLKRENWEKALFSAAQMGVQTIIPIITEKSQTPPRSLENLCAPGGRWHKILIAGCEQAKSYRIPEVIQPVTLEKLLEENSKNIICFEAGTQPLAQLVDRVISEERRPVPLLFGPEGGFTTSELTLLNTHAQLYALTPTILRSIDAIILGLGLIRSLRD